MSDQKIVFSLEETPDNEYTREIISLFSKILVNVSNTYRIKAYDIGVDWLTDPDLGLAQMVPSSSDLYALKQVIKDQLNIWIIKFKALHAKEDLASLANYLKLNPSKQ